MPDAACRRSRTGSSTSPCATPSGADPRPRGDLRPGDPHLAPGGAPGRPLRHLLLLPARRDRAVRARAGGANRVRLRSPLRAAGHDPVHGPARRRAGGTRRARGTGRSSADDGRPARRRADCRPSPAAARSRDRALGAPRARVRLREPRRAGAVHGCPWSRAGDAGNGDRGLSGPRSRVVGEALETIGRRSPGGGVLLDSRGRRRPAIDLVYRAIVCAATEIPDAG